MSTQPNVVVIQPGDDDPLGRFDAWLSERGIAIHTIRPYVDDVVPEQLSADGLIVLGGDMSATDDTHHPWLERVRALFRDAVHHEKPTLGICLGSQILAQALGGTVTQGEAGVEAGLVTITRTAAAAKDALFSGIDRDFPVASMHGDVVAELPDGATLLGSSDTYPHQAFRVAPTTWGLQFHPEIAPETYAAWAAEFRSPDAAQRDRVARGITELADADDAIRRTAAQLAARFAGLVTTSAHGVGGESSQEVPLR